jgi:hypothetical protein
MRSRTASPFGVRASDGWTSAAGFAGFARDGAFDLNAVLERTNSLAPRSRLITADSEAF